MAKGKYCGVVVPMVTPVTEYGKLDTEAVEKIIEMFAQAGVHPLLMGTTGEGNSVSKEDAVLLVKTAAKAAKGRITIYAGLCGTCVSEQFEQGNRFFEAGADVVAATLPSYYALTPEQMEEYYTTLAEALHGPLMLYNITITTHMSIPLDVVKRLADHPNIVGLKDSENNLERLDQCLELIGGRDDFAYFCGCAANSAHALAHGANGIVPSGGNMIPEKNQQLYEAGVRGDKETAERLQKETDAYGQIYQKGFTLGQSLAALKVMMTTRGLCQPWMLPPLTRISAEDEARVLAETKKN